MALFGNNWNINNKGLNTFKTINGIVGSALSPFTFGISGAAAALINQGIGISQAYNTEGLTEEEKKKLATQEFITEGLSAIPAGGSIGKGVTETGKAVGKEVLKEGSKELGKEVVGELGKEAGKTALEEVGVATGKELGKELGKEGLFGKGISYMQSKPAELLDVDAIESDIIKEVTPAVSPSYNSGTVEVVRSITRNPRQRNPMLTADKINTATTIAGGLYNLGVGINALSEKEPELTPPEKLSLDRKEDRSAATVQAARDRIANITARNKKLAQLRGANAIETANILNEQAIAGETNLAAMQEKMKSDTENINLDISTNEAQYNNQLDNQFNRYREQVINQANQQKAAALSSSAQGLLNLAGQYGQSRLDNAMAVEKMGSDIASKYDYMIANTDDVIEKSRLITEKENAIKKFNERWYGNR